MKIEVVVPQIGEAVAALKLLTWRKAVGDSVKKGEVLFEVDSDKAIVEVESFVDGTLSEILAPADSDVMPQQVVAHIETVTEKVAVPVEAVPNQQGNGRKVSPVAQRLADDLAIDLHAISGSGPSGRVLTDDVRRAAQQTIVQKPAFQRVNASPKAKRLAREKHVDLTSLRAAHPDGMIRAHEVELAAAQLKAVPASSSPLHPFSSLQRAAALRTQTSKQTVPHFYLMADVNMTQVNQLREFCRVNRNWEKPPTYTALLLRACALVLEVMPAVNRSYSADGFVTRDKINIGVAVDTDTGLVVPVLSDVNKCGLHDVSLALSGTVERARKGTLKLSDLGDKSMVISNLGMYSVDAFIAIIDMPDPLILAVGQVADRVVAVNGAPAVQPMCTLTLSADHRALDGATAARFLDRLKAHLEYPYELMG